MEVTRLVDAKPYTAPKHVDTISLRLQGHDASGAEAFWVGLSYYLPGGTAELDASPFEKIYIMVEGELTMITDEGEETLGPLDSVRFAPNEQRAIENRTNRPATMLVAIPYPPA